MLKSIVLCVFLITSTVYKKPVNKGWRSYEETMKIFIVPNGAGKISYKKSVLSSSAMDKGKTLFMLVLQRRYQPQP